MSQTPVYILSFLGTGNYTPCKYVTADWDSGVVTFVQTAVAKYWHDSKGRDIVMKIFCTQSAKAKHWDRKPDDKQTYLPEELDKAGFKNAGDAEQKTTALKVNTYECIDVADPFSEEGIWKLFNSLRELDIPEGAEIVFDITHSFRSLPIVMSVLLNYLQATKHVKLVGCHYGAFEQLLQKSEGGTMSPKEYAEIVPNPEDRKAPLVSIERIFQLNEWAQAVHEFEELGNGHNLNQLAEKCVNDTKRNASDRSVNPKTKKEQHQGSPKQLQAGQIGVLAKMVCQFSDNVLKNRLGGTTGILKTEFTEKLKFTDTPDKQDTDEQDGFMNALVPLVQKISADLTNTLGLKTPKNEQEGALNGIRAAYWAANHDLIPQALTLLEESIISFVMEILDIKPMISRKKKQRDFLTNVLAWRASQENNTRTYNAFRGTKKAQNDAKKIVDTLTPILNKNFWIAFHEIIQKRNDIDHAGTNGSAAREFELDALWKSLFKLPCFKDLSYLLEIPKNQ